MNEILVKLIDLVQSTAPLIWAIAVRQVYSQVAESFVYLVIGIILLTLGLKWGIYVKKNYESLDSGLCGGIIVVAIIALLVGISLTVTNLIDVLQKLINPQFYAIQILLDMVK
jgi:hypothetical protein